jgi:hypothetical protein
MAETCSDCGSAIGDVVLDHRRVHRPDLVCVGCSKHFCRSCGFAGPARCRPLDPAPGFSGLRVVCEACAAHPPDEKACTRCGAYIHREKHILGEPGVRFQICVNSCHVRIGDDPPSLPEYEPTPSDVITAISPWCTRSDQACSHSVSLASPDGSVHRLNMSAAAIFARLTSQTSECSVPLHLIRASIASSSPP